MTRDDPATPMRCEVVVAGPVAAAVLTRLRTRFDVFSTQGRDGDTVLVVDGADQATQRAFLSCLWDSGQVVVGLSSLPR
jgi:hypothetical protein